jgi:ATP-dependent RNA helicase DeaD
VHRIGRTGRAGRTGTAITLAEPREHRMLRNIERVTGQTIETASVPTVADLKVRRLEVAQAALREVILAGELDAYRGIIASLAEEFDVMDIAAAAVKQHSTQGAGEEKEEEIPTAKEKHPAREREAHRAERAAAPKAAGKPAAKRPRGGDAMAKLYVGAGRKLKIRPGDIVGAIANETGLAGERIGTINVWDRHSIVEVPESLADSIVAALSATTIKGKKVQVRRDRSGT